MMNATASGKRKGTDAPKGVPSKTMISAAGPPAFINRNKMRRKRCYFSNRVVQKIGKMLYTLGRNRKTEP